MTGNAERAIELRSLIAELGSITDGVMAGQNGLSIEALCERRERYVAELAALDEPPRSIVEVPHDLSDEQVAVVAAAWKDWRVTVRRAAPPGMHYVEMNNEGGTLPAAGLAMRRSPGGEVRHDGRFRHDG